MKLEKLKTYIEIKLVNGFIKLLMLPACVLNLFIQKFDINICFDVDY